MSIPAMLDMVGIGLAFDVFDGMAARAVEIAVIVMAVAIVMGSIESICERSNRYLEKPKDGRAELCNGGCVSTFRWSCRGGTEKQKDEDERKEREEVGREGLSETNYRHFLHQLDCPFWGWMSRFPTFRWKLETAEGLGNEHN